jgi:Tol biopolymer transport system component
MKITCFRSLSFKGKFSIFRYMFRWIPAFAGMTKRAWIPAFAGMIMAVQAFAQFDPHPELDWYTIETPHFYVIYHKGGERSANTAAKIAEEVYGPITSLYKYEPDDKVSLVISDVSDYGNGATDYYGNRIEIYATTLDVDFRMRGTHNWLRNVITHEFTHAVQVQQAMKFARKLPAIYLQWLNYEDERRPDVLYGYPNVIVSYPLSGVDVPVWFAEGTAQYQRQQLGYDYWDSHRDMLLRMRTLGNNLLTWEEMGQFASVTTYKAESIYNQGFGLTRYIAWKYGEDKLKEVSQHMGDILNLNSEAAFRKAIGKSGKELYDEWKSFLVKDYNQRVKNLKPNLVEGEQLVKTGFANYYPKISPDGKKVSYLSNQESDYSGTSLFIKPLAETGLRPVSTDSNEELLISGVSVNYSWSPDGKKIIFSRRNPATIHGVRVFDIYEFDVKSKKEKQLTHGLRAHSPSYSPDGKKVVFVFLEDGTQNLAAADVDNMKAFERLTNFNGGEQVFNPKWSPDGKYIVFDYSLEGERQIARIHPSSGSFEILFGEKNTDYRDPSFAPDGKLIFVSDRNGIYNIYSYDFANETKYSASRHTWVNQLTNVLGGAFMPSVDSAGNLVYSSFQSTGYKINKLKTHASLDSMIVQKNAVYVRPEKLIGKYAAEDGSNSKEPKNNFDWEKLRNFDDRNFPAKEYTPYTNIATSLFFVPVLRFDNYTKSGKFADIIKPGLYFFSSDVLGKMGIFGGASINKRLERDLFLQFEYNNGVPFFKDFFNKKLSFVPRFDLAGYNITRKTDAMFVAGLDTVSVEVTYDLLQFDFQMAFKIINLRHNLQTGFTFSKYSSKVETFVFPRLGQIPSFSTNYFTGRDLSLQYSYANFEPYKNDDIDPIGRYARLRYDYEFNSLNPTLEVDDQGNLIEVFEKANFHRLEGEWFEAVRLFGSHSASLRLKGGAILGQERDNFFDFYASGYPGMKGYPFYAIGGNRYLTANLTYRFPVVEGLDFKFLQFYFDKIYLSLYGDVGNAWNRDAVKPKDFKKDVGAELRLQLYSWYVFPTSIAFNAAYGMDEFQRVFPTTTEERTVVKYGKEWRFYFTMLFGFDFFGNSKKFRF